jgi:hypothetical protein
MLEVPLLPVPDAVLNGAIHDEGPVGSTLVKLIAVYVVEKGKPLVTPVK